MCRACGASEEYGWHDEHIDTDVEDDAFDYDEFVNREFPDQTDSVPEIPWVRLVILAIVVAMILATMGR